MTRDRAPLERVAARDPHTRAWICTRWQRAGWECTRGLHLDGPCALLPRWWNLPGRWRTRWTR